MLTIIFINEIKDITNYLKLMKFNKKIEIEISFI